MSLPTIAAPEYFVKLISMKEPVKFRPYLVKEEKIFLTAKESDDPKQIEHAVKQVLENCTFGAIDVGNLPSFDIEYLFLQLRAKSVNNIVEVRFKCQNDVNDAKCDAIVPVSINLDQIAPKVPEGHTNRIQLDDQITLVMKYPTLNLMESILQNGTTGLVNIGQAVAQCIDLICTADGRTFEARDHTPDELTAFVDQLSVAQLERVQVFFTTMPTLVHDAAFKCSKCGYEETIHFSGIMDFFE